MAKTDRLVIRITPDLKSQLQAAAEADGRSVSNYIEKLIKEAIKKEDFFFRILKGIESPSCIWLCTIILEKYGIYDIM